MTPARPAHAPDTAYHDDRTLSPDAREARGRVAAAGREDIASEVGAALGYEEDRKDRHHDVDGGLQAGDMSHPYVQNEWACDVDRHGLGPDEHHPCEGSHRRECHDEDREPEHPDEESV